MAARFARTPAQWSWRRSGVAERCRWRTGWCRRRSDWCGHRLCPGTVVLSPARLQCRRHSCDAIGCWHSRGGSRNAAAAKRLNYTCWTPATADTEAWFRGGGKGQPFRAIRLATSRPALVPPGRCRGRWCRSIPVSIATETELTTTDAPGNRPKRGSCVAAHRFCRAKTAATVRDAMKAGTRQPTIHNWRQMARMTAPVARQPRQAACLRSCERANAACVTP